MKKLDFSFFRNKFYIYGFISGLLVSVFILMILTAIYNQQPNSCKVKGTIVNKECPRNAKDSKKDCSDCH